MVGELFDVARIADSGRDLGVLGRGAVGRAGRLVHRLVVVGGRGSGATVWP